MNDKDEKYQTAQGNAKFFGSLRFCPFNFFDCRSIERILHHFSIFGTDLYLMSCNHDDMVLVEYVCH